MLKNIPVLNKLFTGNPRTVKANKNIIASFFIKGASIVIGFLIFRLTLDYLDQTKYGIWLTLSSFLTWFTFFEIGLGSGLRNKLAEALAVKDYTLGKIYVSTTYVILTIVISIVALLFFIGNNFLDWTKILNTNKSMAGELSNLALIVFGFFFLRFVVKLIGMVLYADQRPALANIFGPIGNLFTLIIIYILTKTTHGSLIYLGWTLSVLPVLVLIIASLYFYTTDYKKIAPSLHFVKMKYAKNLLNLGVNFFLIRIAGLILYESSNLIIIQFFGPNDVTKYNVVYKLFSIISMVFFIVITPFWNAFTEAWVLKDIQWIKNIIHKLIYVWIGMVFLFLLLFVLSQKMYLLWLNKDMQISNALSFWTGLYFVFLSFSGIYTIFLNGISETRYQIFVSLFQLILFIITVFLLIKYNFGILSIPISLSLITFVGGGLMFYKYNRTINKI